MSTPEEAKALIRRWNDEGWSGGRYELVYEIIGDDTKVHGAGGQSVGMGPDGFKDLIKTWRDSFPDGRMTVDELIVGTDIVAVRNTWHGTHTGTPFYGIPTSGKTVAVTSIGLDRVRDGKVVEGWGELDMLGMMQTLGAMPPVGPGAVAHGEPSEWGPSSSAGGEAATSTDQNLAMTLRFVEALGRGDDATLAEVVDGDAFVDHNPVWGSKDWAGALAVADAWRAALPDLVVTPEADIAVVEGAQVSVHSKISGTHSGADLYGAPASGKAVEWTHNDFVRIAGGRIVERWVSSDSLHLFQQVGLVPGG
ncbi:MAG: ester cyclase [Acidimicrobiales bacterium]